MMLENLDHTTWSQPNMWTSTLFHKGWLSSMRAVRRQMKEQDWKVFTARNLAMRWGVTEREVRDLIKSGDLRVSYVAGRLLRISRDVVLEYERIHAAQLIAPEM